MTNFKRDQCIKSAGVTPLSEKQLARKNIL